MSYFLLYLILMLDNINESLPPLMIILFLVIGISVFSFFCSFGEDDDSVNAHNIIKKILKITIPIFIICGFLSTFLPTTKQAATIYLLPKIASNKDMRQLPSKTAELLLLEVKKEIASLDVGNISGITNAVKKK